ncbi:hypothetical protein [Actinoplanes sp. L3-i22]|uniref:hypothetical protein n=1 Tax=Actinoplanes sp. L3-i22 TaxID=2836373 RepID=UPI001C76DFB4|nr:hypothetical protein [Actinoplanes sp. L3-i22]BCY07061.1 hypothetical protein L3i22_021490 [Actinoplanes sp. L3-i22]
MVNERLRLDPEHVAAAGRNLAGIAQRMADDLTTLEAAVGAGSDPWGTDETGSVFALAYRAVRDVALDAMGSYTEQVGFAATTLVMLAGSVVDSDEAGAADIYGAGGSVPSPTPNPGPGPTPGGGPAPAPAPTPAPAPGSGG